MQIRKRLLIFIFTLAIYKVQAKVVKRYKRMSYPEPDHSYSIPLAPQRTQISGQETYENIKSSLDAHVVHGKPLHFSHGSMYEQAPVTNGNYEGPLSDTYELTNYENLERMFDAELEFPEPQGHLHPNYPSSRAKIGTEFHTAVDVFREDQVFPLKNKEKRPKSKFSNRERGTKSSQFPRNNLKSSDVEQPCDNVPNNDYKNKSTSEYLIDKNGDTRSVNYNEQYEPHLQLNNQSITSEDFHQDKTVIHKDVEQVQHTKSPKESATDNSNTFLENFGRNIQGGAHEQSNPPERDFVANPEIDLEASAVPGSSQSKMEFEVLKNLKLDQPLHSETDTVSAILVESDDKQLLKTEVNHMFDTNFRSFVFNPNAQTQDMFQECKTPKNESGHCRYVQHCMLPSILSSIQHFMDNVCIIQEQFIGVCCPEFPVATVLVNWPDKQDNFSSVEDIVEVPEDCGVGTNRRIVGGLDADRKAWPWMVALLNSKKKFFCGGSLINNRYVLTAAHCTFGPSSNQIIARLGEYDLNDPREPHDDYLVVEIKRHGQYARFTLRNDIAVLKLERSVVFNEFVKTICLPEPDKDYLGKPVTLAGWGHQNGAPSSVKSDVLQEASFPIIGNIECAASHGVPVPPSLICAAATSKDKGACNGDSGGPLMLLDSDERWKILGIVSWGRRGCNPKFPTVYTRVTNYLDWIKEHAT